MAKVKKRQQLSAITTKRLPSGYHIMQRLAERDRRRGKKPVYERVRSLGEIIAERKRVRRVKELAKKLEKAITNAERRGYTGAVRSKGSCLDDPRVKVLQRAYFKALGVK